jgi:succinate dehydrogenase flavin-adding protein (antitoxin of CptAB toxin-antitoxin module)
VNKLARRLQRIKDHLSKNPSSILDMTDDELAQVITGNSNARASDLTTEQLEAIAGEANR